MIDVKVIFGQFLIGWMYQYYNTELKDDTFAKLKKNVKITKERIPAATQLFTPDWIVRYMVENSLGRVWIEHLRAVDFFVLLIANVKNVLKNTHGNILYTKNVCVIMIGRKRKGGF